MQEVRSSNLLSSTGRKHNSNRSNSEYSSKVQQRRSDGPPYVCSDRASSSGWDCWQDTEVAALDRRLIGLSPGQIRPRRSMTLAIWSPPCLPGGRCLPVTVVAFASGPGPRSLTVGSARGPVALRRWGKCGAGPALRCAAQAPGCAVARPCAPAGALLRAHEEPGAARRKVPGRGSGGYPRL
jgi:hypothetical protein